MELVSFEEALSRNNEFVQTQLAFLQQCLPFLLLIAAFFDDSSPAEKMHYPVVSTIALIHRLKYNINKIVVQYNIRQQSVLLISFISFDVLWCFLSLYNQDDLRFFGQGAPFVPHPPPLLRLRLKLVFLPVVLRICSTDPPVLSLRY